MIIEIAQQDQIVVSKGRELVEFRQRACRKSTTPLDGLLLSITVFSVLPSLLRAGACRNSLVRNTSITADAGTCRGHYTANGVSIFCTVLCQVVALACNSNLRKRGVGSELLAEQDEYTFQCCCPGLR